MSKILFIFLINQKKFRNNFLAITGNRMIAKFCNHNNYCTKGDKKRSKIIST